MGNDAEAPRPDGPGLYGPGSVTWRVHADPVAGLALLTADLLAALHPGVEGPEPATVWERWRVARHTVGATTFGTVLEALAVAARADAMRRMPAAASFPGLRRLAVAGGPGAEDPAVWSHCCRVRSVLDVTRRAGLRLDDADADRYVAEQVRAATLTGLEPDRVPHDAAGLGVVLDAARPALRAGAAARAAATAVAEGSATPGGPLPGWHPVAGLAVAALPAWARDLYELPVGADTGAVGLGDAATTLALSSLRAALLRERPVVPPMRRPTRG